LSPIISNNTFDLFEDKRLFIFDLFEEKRFLIFGIFYEIARNRDATTLEAASFPALKLPPCGVGASVLPAPLCRDRSSHRPRATAGSCRSDKRPQGDNTGGKLLIQQKISIEKR
jgi:hypothetical protein